MKPSDLTTAPPLQNPREVRTLRALCLELLLELESRCNPSRPSRLYESALEGREPLSLSIAEEVCRFIEDWAQEHEAHGVSWTDALNSFFTTQAQGELSSAQRDLVRGVGLISLFNEYTAELKGTPDSEASMPITSSQLIPGVMVCYRPKGQLSGADARPFVGDIGHLIERSDLSLNPSPRRALEEIEAPYALINFPSMWGFKCPLQELWTHFEWVGDDEVNTRLTNLYEARPYDDDSATSSKTDHPRMSPFFRVGMKVRVHSDIETPRYGWGSVTAESVGVLTEIGDRLCTVRFSEQPAWSADPQELTLAESLYVLKNEMIVRHLGNAGYEIIDDPTGMLIPQALLQLEHNQSPNEPMEHTGGELGLGYNVDHRLDHQRDRDRSSESAPPPEIDFSSRSTLQFLDAYELIFALPVDDRIFFDCNEMRERGFTRRGVQWRSPIGPISLRCPLMPLKRYALTLHFDENTKHCIGLSSSLSSGTLYTMGGVGFHHDQLSMTGEFQPFACHPNEPIHALVDLGRRLIMMKHAGRLYCQTIDTLWRDGVSFELCTFKESLFRLSPSTQTLKVRSSQPLTHWEVSAQVRRPREVSKGPESGYDDLIPSEQIFMYTPPLIDHQGSIESEVIDEVRIAGAPPETHPSPAHLSSSISVGTLLYLLEQNELDDQDPNERAKGRAQEGLGSPSSWEGKGATCSVLFSPSSMSLKAHIQVPIQHLSPMGIEVNEALILTAMLSSVEFNPEGGARDLHADREGTALLGEGTLSPALQDFMRLRGVERRPREGLEVVLTLLKRQRWIAIRGERRDQAPHDFYNYFMVADDDHNAVLKGTVIRGIYWDGSDAPLWQVVYGPANDDGQEYVKIDRVIFIGDEVTRLWIDRAALLFEGERSHHEYFFRHI
jgi:hypothetical protein